MTGLKLGPLPKNTTVRMTISLPESLKEELDLYSAEYGRLHEQIDTALLIPHMLESFLRSDRGWRSRHAAIKAERGGRAQREAPPRPHEPY